MNKVELKSLIQRYLRRQGFRIRSGRVYPPENLDKQKLRELHSSSVEHKVERSGKSLARLEPRLIEHIAAGSEVVPEKISPRLVEVEPDSEEELLFRYASLHWSIPVSSGYGRRLRFLVVDDHNQKLIGIIGLGDPVFSLSARDQWVGWTASARRQRLYHVMDAFALGAVPPYSFLLCGKLIAMITASNEVRDAFSRKYGGHISRIKKRHLDARLAMITTTSALGRSSIYNRIKFGDRLLFERVGVTRGFGEFQFSNGLYKPISDYTNRWCLPTDRKKGWGTGFRNRREVVRKCLIKIGLSSAWRVHGVQRDVYVIPLARNTKEFLRGTRSRLQWHDQSVRGLFQFFRERWLLPRSERDHRYKVFERSHYTLWN